MNECAGELLVTPQQRNAELIAGRSPLDRRPPGRAGLMSRPAGALVDERLELVSIDPVNAFGDAGGEASVADPSVGRLIVDGKFGGGARQIEVVGVEIVAYPASNDHARRVQKYALNSLKP